MRINPINTSIPFNGRVVMNKMKITNEIASCPKAARESLIGNINSLKARLEQNTPEWKTFNIEFYHDVSWDSQYSPTYYQGIIRVKDENGESEVKSFDLGQLGGKFLANRNFVPDGKTIWHKGFEEITEKLINKQYTYSQNLSEKGNFSQEVREITDRIEDRDERIIIDKEEIAYAIIGAVQSLNDGEKENELKCAIIDNINTLTKRIEESTSPLKKYKIIPSGGFCSDFKCCYHFGMKVDALDTSNEYFSKDIVIADVDMDDNWKLKNIATGQDIWDRLFKGLTEKVLWDGYHHLPFEND